MKVFVCLFVAAFAVSASATFGSLFGGNSGSGKTTKIIRIINLNDDHHHHHYPPPVVHEHHAEEIHVEKSHHSSGFEHGYSVPIEHHSAPQVIHVQNDHNSGLHHTSGFDHGHSTPIEHHSVPQIIKVIHEYQHTGYSAPQSHGYERGPSQQNYGHQIPIDVIEQHGYGYNQPSPGPVEHVKIVKEEVANNGGDAWQGAGGNTANAWPTNNVWN